MRLWLAALLGGILFTTSASAKTCVTIGYWAEEAERVKAVIYLIGKAYEKANICHEFRVTSRARANQDLHNGELGAIGWEQIEVVHANEELIGLEPSFGYTDFDIIYDKSVFQGDFDTAQLKGQNIGISRYNQLALDYVKQFQAKAIEVDYWDTLFELLNKKRVVGILVGSTARQLQITEQSLSENNYAVHVLAGTTYVHVVHKKHADQIPALQAAFDELYGNGGFLKALIELEDKQNGS